MKLAPLDLDHPAMLDLASMSEKRRIRHSGVGFVHHPVSSTDTTAQAQSPSQADHIEHISDRVTTMDETERSRLVSHEAAYWYVLATDRNLSRSDKRQFLTWLRRSPENIKEFLRIAQMDGAHARIRLSHKADEIRVLDTEKSATESRQRCLSHSYVRDLKRQHVIPKLALVMVACAALAISITLQDPRPLAIAGISFACLVLICIKDCVVSYRVSLGLFGTTESESRDLIRFIIVSAENIDFTDDNGRPRPSLVPYPTTPPARAETIHPGVLSS